jgi:hypothetical protein
MQAIFKTSIIMADQLKLLSTNLMKLIAQSVNQPAQ